MRVEVEVDAFAFEGGYGSGGYTDENGGKVAGDARGDVAEEFGSGKRRGSSASRIGLSARSV